MYKYCPSKSCRHFGKPVETDAEQCPACGEVLHKCSFGDSPLVNGDANAISELHNTAGSYNTDIRDSHDTHNSNTVNYVINNIQRAEGEQSLAERKTAYREACLSLMRNGHIIAETREALDKRAMALNLESSITREIELDVQRLIRRRTENLNSGERMNLDIVISQIKNNSPDLRQSLPKLEAMSDIDIEEVQFYVNMVTAFEDPGSFIRKYERRNTDNYWQTYWAYAAYRKMGVTNKAEIILRELGNWHDYAPDNILLLNIAGLLYPKDDVLNDANLRLAKEHLKRCGSISPILKPFLNCVCCLANKNHRTPGLSGSAECNYYLTGFFGIRPQPKFENPSPAYSMRPAEIPDIQHSVPGPVAPNTAPPFLRSINKTYFIAAALILLFFVLGQTIKSRHSEERAAEIPAEHTEVPIVNEGTTQVARTQPSGHAKAPEAAAAKPQPVKEQASPKSATAEAPQTAAIIQPAELSASELLSKGMSSVKKFQPEQALTYFLQAAEKGSTEANYHIGDLYYNGNGVGKNFSTAKSYFEKAANQGMAEAQYMLGVMYRNGQGVTKDLGTARDWLQKAAANGSQKAETMLKQL